jgi:hypothetical protein
MIQQISEFEYLGNSLQKFNSNMNELNVRTDILYSDSNKWNSLINEFLQIYNDLFSLTTNVQSNSSLWGSASDIVYNISGYWEEPIQIVYKNTFNGVANLIEIETWLNDNFPSSNFSPTQILRCDYLCKNYSPEGLDGIRITQYKPEILQELASDYFVSVNEIFDFLSYKNQLESLMVVFNALFRKYGKNDLIITGIEQMSTLSDLVVFNRNIDSFQSSTLENFNSTDLQIFHSYVSQYNIIIQKYNLYVQRNFEDIPTNVLVQFQPKNVSVHTGGYFFFKIRNGRWSYHEYKNIEFCAINTCSDCYNVLDINKLYGEKDCPQRFKYLLTECEFVPPYVIPYITPYIEMLSFAPQSDNSDDYSILDQLFS